MRQKIASHESALRQRGPLPVFHYLESMATRPNWIQRAVMRTKKMLKSKAK